MDAILDTGTGHGFAGAIGEHRCFRPPIYLFEPRIQLCDCALPERDDALLSSFTMQMHGVGAIDEDVGNTLADNPGDARTNFRNPGG